jgi:acyl-CoA dehydrogenase family protein 9
MGIHTGGIMSTEQNEYPSIAKSLFFGQFHEEHIFPYPHFSSDEVEMGKAMIDAVNKFGEQIDSSRYDLEGVVPDEILQGLAELGLCGLAVSEEFNGLGLDHNLYSRVFSELACTDGSIATMLGAHQSIGYKALLNEGTEEQKKKWLPKLASGETFAAFCLTEPGSGSDAYSIKTKAVKNDDGTFTINGQKLWITNGGKAGFYSVFCKTEHEIDGETKEKISCFIVEKDRDGVSFGEKEDKMGIRASETRAVYFDNVRVPAENMIGQPGKGFKIAMNVLNTGRLSLGSGSVGGMKGILELATNHAKTRKQFGDAIANYGLIQDKLAKMAASTYASECMVYFTTGMMQRGMSDFSVESAICKVYCSENLWDCVDKGLQIAAGNGYMREYPYERMMRDARINLIFEGTNEILRIFIALSGLKGPSDSLKELGKIADVSKVLQDPIKSVGVLTNFAKNRLGKMISTKTITGLHEDLESYGANLSNLVNEFSIKTENVLIKYGKNIIGNELPQKRLANMVIELYAMIAVLSRTSTILKDESISEDDKEYVKNLTALFFKDSRQAFVRNSKRLSGNYDRTVPNISNTVCKKEGYGLDILNF